MGVGSGAWEGRVWWAGHGQGGIAFVDDAQLSVEARMTVFDKAGRLPMFTQHVKRYLVLCWER